MSLEAITESIRSTGAAIVAGPLEGIFPALDAEIAARGKTWRDVVRTWFYIRDIAANYARFNELRTAAFAARGVSPLPASTGIGLDGDVPEVTAAVIFASEGWRPVASPLQVEASVYGSRFSRAAEVVGGALYVSGTAALEGVSVAAAGDFAAQMNLALDAVEAILSSRGRTWRDVTRAIAYCRDASDIPFARSRLSPDGPYGFLKVRPLVVRADVCRPDWLFELEVDAR